MALTLDIKGEAASERLNRLDTIRCIGADLLTPMRAGIIGALSAAARFARALWDHEYNRDGRE